MVVARGGDGEAQQVLIFVHGLDDRHEEQQEAGVLIGRLAGGEQVFAAVRGEGPVVVLAGAVHPGKGLFVQQADQPVPPRHLLHDLHRELVVVRGDVGGLEDRGHLVLGRGHLVVLRLRQDAQLPELLVQILHVGLYPRLDRAEVVVLQLLALRGLRAEEGAPGEDQILALEIHLAVHQKILLLRPHVGDDALHPVTAEEPQNAQGLLVEGLHAAQQRGLLVQGVPAVGAEGCGDAQHLVLDKGVAGGVPGGVAAGLEGGAQTAGGEGGGVRLAPDQLFAGELHDDPAVRGGIDEAVVLFCRDAGERLEPVREVGGAVHHGPGAHGVCHGVRKMQIELLPVLDGAAQRAVDLLGQTGAHDLVVKHLAGKQFRYGGHIVISFQNKKRETAASAESPTDAVVSRCLHVTPNRAGCQPSFCKKRPGPGGRILEHLPLTVRRGRSILNKEQRRSAGKLRVFPDCLCSFFMQAPLWAGGEPPAHGRQTYLAD